MNPYTPEDLAIFKRNRERGLPRTDYFESSQAIYQLSKKWASEQGKVETLVCEGCGSVNVAADGIAEWNAEKQRFELVDVYDLHRTVWCNDCDLCEQDGQWAWR